MDKAESIISSYEDIHNEAKSYTTKDVWDNLENLALAIKERGYFLGDEIIERIKTRRKENNLCPDCSEELSSKQEIVNITEAWGKQVQETCDKLNCSSCGWCQ